MSFTRRCFARGESTDVVSIAAGDVAAVGIPVSDPAVDDPCQRGGAIGDGFDFGQPATAFAVFIYKDFLVSGKLHPIMIASLGVF